MTLEQIHSVVREFLSSSFDTENIACDLWVEAFFREKTRLEETATVTEVSILSKHELDPPLSREVIRNRCVDELRKRKTEDRAKQEFKVPPDQILVDIPTVIELAIKELPLSQRNIIFEKFYLGSSLRMIAEHLSLTTTQTQKLLQNALETLRSVTREKESER